MADKNYHVYRMKGPGHSKCSRVIHLRRNRLAKTPKLVSEMRIIDISESYQHNFMKMLRKPNSIRPSLAQALAGSGALVFEGELLDL